MLSSNTSGLLAVRIMEKLGAAGLDAINEEIIRRSAGEREAGLYAGLRGSVFQEPPG